MARAKLNKTALQITSGGSRRLALAPGRPIYVLEPNGLLDRVIDPLDVAATETLATVYATETGGTTLTQPLTSDTDGRFPGWVDEESYDLYAPTDSYSPIERFEAITGSTLVGGGSGGVVIQDEGVALTTRAALNFVGSGVTATDDAAGSRTKVAVPSGARMKSGLWYPAVGQSGVATATYVRDAIYFMPFLLPGALDGIALEVTTAAPGAVIRLGFYDDTGFGEPRNLLGSEQTVSGDTIGGKVVTFAPVSGEVIWTAVVCQVADAGFRDAFPIATAPVPTDSALEAVRGFGVSYRSLGFSGALPATASGLQYLNNAPRTGVRAA